MTQVTLTKIMVVDDDPDILAQMEKIFAKLKIEYVKTFTNGPDAIKELETNEGSFDCVFIDVRMPGMSGVGFIQHLKSHKDKRIKDLFCIPIVGTVAKEETIVLQEINCLETINKPIVESVFIKRFEELVKIHSDPESEKNFQMEFANCLLDKKYKQAEQLLLPKIKKEPNSVRYLVMYSELLIRAKQWEKAEEFLNRVLKIDPNYIPALNLISKVYIKSNRYDEAMTVLEKAKNLSPLHIERLLVMGEMNLGAGKSELAEENFRNALKINPSEEKAAFGLGRALATQGKVEESKKILSNLQKGVELASFFNNKGILLVRSKKINDGISLYQNAIKVMDDKEREHLLLYNIALAYSKLGNIDSALEYAKKSQAKAPKDYAKVARLIEKLENEKKQGSSPSLTSTAGMVNNNDAVSSINNQNSQGELSENQNFLLTDNQVEFIMGGFDDSPKKEEEMPKQEDEFITFGLE